MHQFNLMVSFENSLSNVNNSTEVYVPFLSTWFADCCVVLTEKARLSEEQSLVDDGSRLTVTSQDGDSALKSDKSIELLVIDGQHLRV